MNGALLVLLSGLVALRDDGLLALDDMLGDGEDSLERIGVGATGVLGRSVEINDLHISAVVVVDNDLEVRKGERGAAEGESERRKAESVTKR